MYLRHAEGFILSQLWVPVYTNYFYVVRYKKFSFRHTFSVTGVCFQLMYICIYFIQRFIVRSVANCRWNQRTLHKGQKMRRSQSLVTSTSNKCECVNVFLFLHKLKFSNKLKYNKTINSRKVFIYQLVLYPSLSFPFHI